MQYREMQYRKFLLECF